MSGLMLSALGTLGCHAQSRAIGATCEFARRHDRHWFNRQVSRHRQGKHLRDSRGQDGDCRLWMVDTAANRSMRLTCCFGCSADDSLNHRIRSLFLVLQSGLSDLNDFPRVEDCDDDAHTACATPLVGTGQFYADPAPSSFSLLRLRF